jgi:hypothetical protein
MESGKKEREMKVFSLERFTEDCRNAGESEEDIKRFIRHWARGCEGLTEFKMDQKNLPTDPAWMIEKGEEK